MKATINGKVLIQIGKGEPVEVGTIEIPINLVLTKQSEDRNVQG